ncbi:MAG: UDP-N-acetylmuramate--L-alanine ligase [Alphaproteobacteria bacterium]|nr:UDP-N-acetylmuramate--L-alanine ligase [Alphaproteobacteria bacterium]
MRYLSTLPEEHLVHFTGIGGIGMSGICEILHSMGYTIQGSDLSSNLNTKRLKSLKIKIYEGHNIENLKDISLLVKSSAIKDNNPEVLYCKRNNIPVISRTEMLAELMSLKTSIAVSGTHGKTTTTSLIASIFEQANASPTVINGGIINTKGTNAYVGKGEFLIAEADESDATFIKIPSKIAVITNIDPEHLDFYGSYENLKKAFKTFISNLPFYGFGVLCIDCPETKKLYEENKDRTIITYSIKSEDADIYAHNIVHTEYGNKFDVKLSNKIKFSSKSIKNIIIPVPGIHNVQNSLAAIAIALQLGFSERVISNGFSEFSGVKRRFTKIGTYNGVSIIDDYAHHPTEIKATLETARQVVRNTKGKIIVIFQPHRYTRLKNLMNEFAASFQDADIVYIADVYNANEDPIPGIDNKALVGEIKKHNFNDKVQILESKDNIPNILQTKCNNNDLLLFLGAGDITKWANDLPNKLKTS